MIFNINVFLLGVAGGSIAELLRWWQLRESSRLPAYGRKPIYWIITSLMVLVGGLLAVVHGVDSSKPLLAINIGISAPLILKAMASTIPPEVPSKARGRGPDATDSALNFLAGR